MSSFLWMKKIPPSSRAYSTKRCARDITAHLDGLDLNGCIDRYRLNKIGIDHFVENIKDMN